MDYQIEFATTLDYCLLYIRMIKAHATDVHVSKDIHNFMHQVEKKTKIMTNFLLVDAQISKYKPSVLAAALIFAAFTL